MFDGWLPLAIIELLLAGISFLFEGFFRIQNFNQWFAQRVSNGSTVFTDLERSVE
jgi:hypothetical protein